MAQNKDADSINLTALCTHSYPNDLTLKRGILLWTWVFVCLIFQENLLPFLIEIYNSNYSPQMSQPEVHNCINLTDCQIHKQIGSAFQTLVQ